MRTWDYNILIKLHLGFIVQSSVIHKVTGQSPSKSSISVGHRTKGQEGDARQSFSVFLNSGAIKRQRVHLPSHLLDNECDGDKISGIEEEEKFVWNCSLSLLHPQLFVRPTGSTQKTYRRKSCCLLGWGSKILILGERRINVWQIGLKRKGRERQKDSDYQQMTVSFKRPRTYDMPGESF